MEYTTLRDVFKPKPIPRRPTPPPLRKPPTPTPAKAERKAERQRKCPSGFRWDSKKGKCVQAGVGPIYKP